MKVTNQELEVLKLKYKEENLDEFQIKNRLKNLDEMDEYVKFSNKYLNKRFKQFNTLIFI